MNDAPACAARSFAASGLLVSALAAGCGADPSASTSPFPSAAPVSGSADAGQGASGGGATGGATNPSVSNVPVGAITTVTPESNPGSVCQQFTIANGHITPDMLIVLDRSSSMQGE